MRFMQVDEAVELVKLEYAETPGLALTPAEARQLWNFSEELCDRALRILVNASFLRCQPDGSFIRAETDPRSARVTPGRCNSPHGLPSNERRVLKRAFAPCTSNVVMICAPLLSRCNGSR